MAVSTRCTVRQGHQAWRLLRTDRDGASAAELPQMAAAAVRWFVRGVGNMGSERGPLHELVSVGPNTWRFGWVRPLRVLSVGRAEPSISGRVLADRQRVPEMVPTVRAQRPWWIVVDFWWRGPDVEIDYPGMTEGLLGRKQVLSGADWLLDRAVVPPSKPDPGDQTWWDAKGTQARKAVETATSDLGRVVAVGGGIGVLVLLYLLSRRL